MAVQDTVDPVVVEGTAEKYSTAYSVDFADPAVNATVRVRPRQAIGLLQADFSGSPTRWRFP